MLKFLLFFVIGLLLYPIFCFIFTFVRVFFGTNSVLKKLEKKVTVLSFEYKTFMLRKKFAEENSINYTTPFEFKYSDDTLKIETTSLSQIEYLNKLQRLEKEVDEIVDGLDVRLKTTAPAVDFINLFYSLKDAIKEANPYVY